MPFFIRAPLIESVFGSAQTLVALRRRIVAAARAPSGDLVSPGIDGMTAFTGIF